MTSICSSNLSIGIFSSSTLESAGFIKVNKRSIDGIFGQYLDGLLTGKDKRRCQFIALNDTSSVLQSLKENKIDFFSGAENLLGDNFQGVEYSTPCNSEKIYIGQILDKPKGTNLDSLGFIEHSKLIVEFIIIGFLLKFLFIIIYLSLKKDKQNNRINLKILRNYLNYNRFSKYLLNKFKLIMIFYLLFKGLNLILLINNMKTNEVILNLDELIDNNYKLFNTKRYACWIKSSNWFNFVLKLDKNTLIRKTYDLKQKSSGDICYLDDLINDFSKISKLDLNKKFIVLNKSVILAILLIISRFQSIENKIGFITSSIFDLEFLKVYLISSKLNPYLKTNLLDKITKIFEFGHYKKFYYENNLILIRLSRIENVYENVYNLKDNLLKINSLNLKYFHNLINILFSFYLLLFAIFVLKNSGKFLIKKIVFLIKKIVILIRKFNYFNK